MTLEELKYRYWIWKGKVPQHLRKDITSFKKWREWIGEAP